MNIIKDLINTKGLNGNLLTHSSYKLMKIDTIEGYLFWSIITYSVIYLNSIDYLTIIEIYHRYGKDVFKFKINPYAYMDKKHIDRTSNISVTLNRNGRAMLFSEINK